MKAPAPLARAGVALSVTSLWEHQNKSVNKSIDQGQYLLALK